MTVIYQHRIIKKNYSGVVCVSYKRILSAVNIKYKQVTETYRTRYRFHKLQKQNSLYDFKHTRYPWRGSSKQYMENVYYLLILFSINVLKYLVWGKKIQTGDLQSVWRKSHHKARLVMLLSRGFRIQEVITIF